MKYFDLNVPLQVHMSDTGENRNSFESARTPVAISVLAGSVYGNEFLAMLDAFHNVIHSFLTADRVNKLFHRGANELRLSPAPVCWALELRLFGQFHPHVPERFDELYEIGDALKIFEESL